MMTKFDALKVIYVFNRLYIVALSLGYAIMSKILTETTTTNNQNIICTSMDIIQRSLI